MFHLQCHFKRAQSTLSKPNCDFTRCGDVNITGDDKICTNCYNAHLGILHEMELLSTNEELKTLVENPSQCISAGGRYSDYVSQALQEVMVKVNILLRNVALLFPEVYRLFINEALQRALVGHTSLDESGIMPRRC